MVENVVTCFFFGTQCILCVTEPISEYNVQQWKMETYYFGHRRNQRGAWLCSCDI